MPAAADRQQLRSEELSEFPQRGVFAGILSEIPPDTLEQYSGFLDLLNVICQSSMLIVRPGFTGLTAIPNPQESINGIADFFNNVGVRLQTIITPTRLLQWNGGGAGSWTPITGTLTGTTSQLFDWTVVNYKLLFSQGTDKVQAWDGVSGSFAAVSANAVACRTMMELGAQLIVANTIESGTAYPQRVRWTGPGDPTDWTSLNAGVADLLNDQGPVWRCVKLFQQGYLIQQFGITQMVPTGNAANPFNFVPISTNNKGTVYPFSVAHQGGEFACYVGIDNVYKFDGTTVIPIGDRRVQGGRLGARLRIMADVGQGTPSSVYGYITTFSGTSYFNAYWLVIPGISVWVYNFDEDNWTRFTYAKVITSMGRFFKAGAIRIMDLIGTIAAQNWTPATLTGTSPLDGVLLGFNDGTPGYVDFTNFSEQNWSITSGQHVFGDVRHQHNVKKFRISIKDNGQIQFTLSVTGIVYPNPNAALDSNGQPISTNTAQKTVSKVITMGNGSGQTVTRVVDMNVPGQYITWQILGLAGAPAYFVEFTPLYDIGGEQRGG